MALKNELNEQGNFLFTYRSYLPIPVLLVALCLYIFDFKTIIKIPITSTPIFEILCVIVACLGFAIRFHCVGYASDNTSGRNTLVGQVADTINKTGLYSLIRHPLYFGNFLIWFGLAAMTQNAWFLTSFTLAYWIYYERIIYAEEHFLINKYGNDYLEYALHTPAFIPKFNSYTKAQQPFRWFKAMKQEKSGILNLFLIVFIFRLAKGIIDSGSFSVEWYWSFALISSIILYVVLKILAKKFK
jgi:protein-S-isoprenylcysteine O-methyltransferase Ste14